MSSVMFPRVLVRDNRPIQRFKNGAIFPKRTSDWIAAGRQDASERRGRGGSLGKLGGDELEGLPRRGLATSGGMLERIWSLRSDMGVLASMHGDSGGCTVIVVV